MTPPPGRISKLTEILKGRGIWETATELGWTEHKDGWLYPVFDDLGDPITLEGKTLARWKNGDSESKNGSKYLWYWGDEPKPSGNTALNALLPSLYVPHDLDSAFIDSVNDVGCTLYIASGEPDVLAMRAAGIKNVTCLFGETNIPDDLKSKLAKIIGLGPKDTVKLYPDLDSTGLKWAQTIARLLAPHGVAVEAFRLPNVLGAKGDLNKLWQHCNFEITKFKEALTACAPLDRATLAPPAPARPSNRLRSTVGDGRTSGLYGKIADALNVKHYNADGRSNNVVCPFHDDTKPSAVWWDNGVDAAHLMCYVCGWHGANDCADRLNIPRPSFVRAPTSGPTPKGVTIEVTSGEQQKVEAVVLYDKQFDDVSFLTMPYRAIAQYGGFCQQLELGKMMAVIGVSGGQKTTFSENVIWAFANDGHSGALYSPEWAGVDAILRQIQRRGGPTYLRSKSHFAFRYETKRGRSVEWCREHGMIPFSDQEQASFDALHTEIKATPGTIYDIRHHYRFDDTKLEFEAAADAARAKGSPLRWICVDYIQLLAHEYGEIMDAIAWLKDFCMVNHTFGLIASQMRKSDSAEVRRGQAPVGGEGMEYAKDNAFNSALVLSADFDELGKIRPWVNVTVVKNSLGPSRQKVRLSYVPNRLLITDPSPSLKYNEEPDVVELSTSLEG